MAIDILPHDALNAQLLANVHPADWVNPKPATHYHMLVIGAGTGGLVTAAGSAGLGAKVALVEKHMMGGDCLNVGCVPSKALIRSATLMADVHAADSLGVRVPPGTQADFGAVMERMRAVRTRISHTDSVNRYSKDFGVDIFLGQGRFTGANTLEVQGQTITFGKAVIATGARAAQPAIEGLAEAGYLTNETVFQLTELPKRLAVIGGGPIGCELAQSFRRFGSEVILFHNADHILNREDADAAEIVQQTLLREGVCLLLNAKTTRVTVEGGQKVLHYERPGGGGTVTVDEILVGAGRTPNVDTLDLEKAGVQYTQRGVTVDDYLRTSNPDIYAVGDVAVPYKFTHAADATARIAIRNALFLGRSKVSDLIMPWVTYTDPEIAHVGLYAHEAAQQGIAIDTYTTELAHVDRAITDGEDEGFIKIHTPKGKDTILGATIVARNAGDMISEITLAMVGKVGLKTLATVIHPYPTQAEVIKRAADAYNRTRLTPTAKQAFTWWLRLAR